MALRGINIYMRTLLLECELGYEKSWEQCRTKVKNLTNKYRKVKDANDVSGSGRTTCPFYDEIDNILGTRAASSPPLLLDSGESHDNESPSEERESVGDKSHTDDSYNESPAPANDTALEESNVTEHRSYKERVLERKKGQKRKRVRVDDGLLDVLKEMEERSEEREIAWEEKRLKFELDMEERRMKREQEQDEKMQTMFGAFLQQMCTIFCPHAPPTFQTPPYHTPRSSQQFPYPPIPTQNSHSSYQGLSSFAPDNDI